ncbi:hypothetical protein [Aestuariirhabdus litorea]|uniref:Uncharacterized protein n=1 Tax=Aestuariirhabdus litorea TaxID=2528527 RepID=A0A3P3VNW5_9GAMM|nr:hypothetical protein [Aestuariirhabdus litorea]RRJ84451.1 hypothetical protein D0544_04925 [Aestuariirhabdus litorea]RWW97675.1 hypothetical protein DZC74_04915 [Endozoicomonadaceae bacterium GTF-13]
MGIDAEQLGLHIIQPTLTECGYYTAAAQRLLLGTAAAESNLGEQLYGKEGGLGLYRISPQVHQQVWDDYLVHYPDLASRTRGLASQRHFLQQPHQELVFNLTYATAIAWFNYLRCGADLTGVEASNTQALADIWWHYYHPTDPDGARFVKHYPLTRAA